LRRLAAALCLIATAAPAHADPTFVDKLRAAIRAHSTPAIVVQPPVLVPPVPVKRAWKLAKVATLDLGAPLAALTAGDADGDGKAELYAVTPRELLAIGILDGKPRILAPAPFGCDAARLAPRDCLASVLVDGGSVIAAASPWASARRASWKSGAFNVVPADAGFPQCPGEVAPLAPGRNYFGDAATGHYGARCTNAFVDPQGRPLRVRGVLSLANKLAVTVETCAAGGTACAAPVSYEHAAVGTAFEIADLDRDGTLELLGAGAGAPGDPDALKIVTLGAGDKVAPKLRKAFAAGGVAGIAVGDVDGDGVPDAIVAVRVVGAPRVDLWRVE